MPLLAFVVSLAALPAAQTFRARVDTVQVFAAVADANGRLVTGLIRDDFEVFEDGVPQTITVFSDERVPISLGVLLDASDSMRGRRIVDARATVDRFVSELLEPGDEVFLAAFNHRPSLLASWTRPPAVLAGRLDELLPTGGTALYDALVASAPLFSRRAHVRAALVVISDGVDTASDWRLVQVRDLLRRTDPLVYAVAIDSAGRGAATRVDVEALREITGTSGGYTEVVRGTADLDPATERIARELNLQYLLGYVPAKPADGSWRSIRVRVKKDGYVTRARRGYFSPVR